MSEDEQTDPLPGTFEHLRAEAQAAGLHRSYFRYLEEARKLGREESNREREELRALLLVPPGFPLVPSLQELVRERNEARSDLADHHLDHVKDLEEARRDEVKKLWNAWSIQSFSAAIPIAKWLWEWSQGNPLPPPVTELELKKTKDQIEAEKSDLQIQIEEIKGLLDSHLKEPEDRKWVRDMIVRGFVPALSVRKARQDRSEAEAESQRWHDIFWRVRVHFDLPYDASYEDMPDLVKKAIRTAENRGAKWILEALNLEGKVDPEEVLLSRYPKDE